MTIKIDVLSTNYIGERARRVGGMQLKRLVELILCHAEVVSRL